MTDGPIENDQDLLRAIAAGVRSLNAKRQWERDNRIALLWVHAEVGLIAGFLMLTYGTASVFHGWWGEPAARLVTGIPPILGGLILAAGLYRRPRAIPWEVVGLCIMALWDLGMSLGLAYALRHGPPGVHSIPYPVVIYGGYFQILSVHLWTLSTRNRVTT